jgi:hypothetical protein
VVVVVVGDGAFVVGALVVDVVEAPTMPVIPASTAIETTVAPVVRSSDRLVRGTSRSRMRAGPLCAPGPRPVAGGRSLLGFEHVVAILLPPQTVHTLVGYGTYGPAHGQVGASATEV